MLKYVYNVYWWVDEDYNFRLEHLNYFERGGQYYTDNVGTDLTTSLEPKTGKSWGYRLKQIHLRKTEHSGTGDNKMDGQPKFRL
jgi:hypothetical protein